MKEFKLFWQSGDTETIYGNDIASAMNNAGIGAGALCALDFHMEITKQNNGSQYKWDSKNHKWVNTDFDFNKILAEIQSERFN